MPEDRRIPCGHFPLFKTFLAPLVKKWELKPFGVWPVKNLYNFLSCGRLSSGYPRLFKTSATFFPAEGYPLPTQGLSKTSTILFTAEGYPLVTEGVFKSSTICFPAEGYPLVTEGVSKTGFYSWVIWAIYWSFLPDIVSHTHTHTHSVRGGCWLLWGASSCCKWPTCSPFKALMVVLDKVWLFTGVLLWAVPATIPGSQGTNKQTSILPYRRWDLPCVASLWCGIQLDQRPTSTRERTVQFTRTSTHP